MYHWSSLSYLHDNLRSYNTSQDYHTCQIGWTRIHAWLRWCHLLFSFSSSCPSSFQEMKWWLDLRFWVLLAGISVYIYIYKYICWSISGKQIHVLRARSFCHVLITYSWRTRKQLILMSGPRHARTAFFLPFLSAFKVQHFNPSNAKICHQKRVLDPIMLESFKVSIPFFDLRMFKGIGFHTVPW